MVPPNSVRLDRTSDTLASLHALHGHIVNQSALSTPSIHANQRLLTAIARKLDVSEDDPLVQTNLVKIHELAKERALDDLQPQIPPLQEGLLEMSSARLAEKAEKLKDTLAQLAVLPQWAADHLQALAVHSEATVATLKESLDEDSVSAHAYLDTLRASVDHEFSNSEDEHAKPEARRLPDPRKLRQDLREAHELRQFIQTSQVEKSQPTQQMLDAAETFRAAEKKVNKKASELLQRKNAKKEGVGDVLVRDIERLKKEVEILANGTL
ncbi:hypothetical protein EIP91_003027 [Steccherinum ochraceum]|uniref:Uncharacterized protein n=1 Tax=Steccherinum ochraceum TaxID=92696 RepID=A0A4R0RB52_9APHY|nr:hypothetical protein EIP91_003027 [Steccherinum ochraceum]